LALGGIEEDVVVGVGPVNGMKVEGRVEVFEVNAFVREDFPVTEPLQIVAEEEPIHGSGV